LFRERSLLARLSCSAYGSFLGFTARSKLIGNDRKGSKAAGRDGSAREPSV